MWEFVLNNKFHKIELFHSKVTGKKKLCLDAQQLVEDQGYQSSFTYSFKLDKHYFNIVQLSLDAFELKIDNRKFESLMFDERSGRLKPSSSSTTSSQPPAKQTNYKPKPQDEPIPDYLRTVDSYKKNEDNFYDSDDGDFDFSGGKSNSNNFTFKKQEEYKSVAKKKPDNQLLDFNDIADIKTAQSYGQSVPQQASNLHTNPVTFQHNQNIFNNINLFEEEKKQPDHNLLLDNIFSGNTQNSNTANYNESNNNQYGFMNASNQNPNMMMNQNNNNLGHLQFNPNSNLNPNVMTGNNNMNMINMNTKPNEPIGNNSNNYQNQMGFGNNNNTQHNFNPNPVSNLNMNIGYGEIQSTQQNRNSNLNTNANNNLNQFNQQQTQSQPYSLMNDIVNPSISPFQASSPDYNRNIPIKDPSSFNIMNSGNQNAMNQQQFQPYQNQAQDIQSQLQEPKNDFKVTITYIYILLEIV